MKNLTQKRVYNFRYLKLKLNKNNSQLGIFVTVCQLNLFCDLIKVVQHYLTYHIIFIPIVNTIINYKCNQIII